METFNEVTNIFLMYHLQCFCDFVPDAQMRSEIGKSFIAFTALNLAVHLYFLGRDFCHKMKGCCCKKCVERRRKKEQDALAKVKAETKPVAAPLEELKRDLGVISEESSGEDSSCEDSSSEDSSVDAINLAIDVIGSNAIQKLESYNVGSSRNLLSVTQI